MVDFTGGCSEMFTIKDPDCPKDLINIMLSAYHHGSLMVIIPRKVKRERDKARTIEKAEDTHRCAQLVSSETRLDLTKEENILFFVCSEAAESKLVKLETSHTVILPLTVSVLWIR